MPDCRPVGIFDSGVGGLSIVREIRRLLPGERLIYVADTRYLPYGNKPETTIRERAFAICDFFVHCDAKAIVVACNTATAAAARELRASFRVPIVGIEPAVKPAANATRTGIVGILATASTLQSRKYGELLERYGHFARVISQPCCGLVERVEAGDFDGPETVALLRRYIAPLLEAGADTLVLGCTHYPFLVQAIRSIVGASVQIVDPSEAVARRLVDVLGEQSAGAGALRCFSTGDPGAQSALMSRLLGQSVEVEALAL